MIYGYARVSTDGQTLVAQWERLKAAGAEKVFEERASGAKSDRKQLGRLLKMPDIRKELRILIQPVVLLALATTAMSASATFTLYTYVAPMLADVSGASQSFVTIALVLIGIGFTIGNALGGRIADWSLDGATTIFLCALALSMLVLPLLLGSEIGAAVGLLAWGAASFGTVPPVQMRVMQAASEAPGLASSINIGAFNLGNAIGAAAGGAVLTVGLGYEAIPIAGSLLAAGGLVLALLGRRGGRPAMATCR
jgi:DHA1 family inner membrane transport protein